MDPITARLQTGSFQTLWLGLCRRIQVYVSGPFWRTELTVLAMLLSALCFGGIHDSLHDLRVKYPPAYYDKITHPLLDTNNRTAQSLGHETKLGFRLTVPVLLHVLRVPPSTPFLLPGLTALAVVLIVRLTCAFAWQVTRDRLCCFFVTLGTATTYSGSLGCTFYYDAIAMAQMVLALLPLTPWFLRGLLVFSASFTDERALLASPLLMVGRLCMTAPREENLFRRLASRDILSMLAGLGACLAGRWLLGHFTSLHLTMQGVMGLGAFLDNAPQWRAGCWFALQGGWLLAGLGLARLWQEKQLSLLLALSLCLAAVLGGGFCIKDVLRSVCYAYPATLIGLAIAARSLSAEQLRCLCAAALAFSLLAGDFHILPNPEDSQPLAVEAARWLLAHRPF